MAYIKRRTPLGGKPPALSTAAELILGAVAGGLAQIFTIPVSVIATRQQVGSSKRKVIKRVLTEKPGEEQEWVEEEHYVDDSFWAIGKEIVREEGPTGLWLGIKPGLVLTVNPAITYGVYERVKSIILIAREKAASASSPASSKLSPGANFLVGALSKTLATVVTYPYIMAKVRIQARGSDAEAAKEEGRTLPPHHAYHHKDSKHPGAIDLLAKVYRKKGLIGWYQVWVLATLTTHL
jgi:adenine nucleotide transporter 17